ncbi:MAG: pilus assembly protein [Acidobacteria bacterium]|nr:pilus assembly protein [Acidobacteriota bacterium]
MRRCQAIGHDAAGSALLEFAIVLPLLVVFIVGIYDFSGAYNVKQKIEHAARSGASAAAGQPTGDMDASISNPDSLQPVVDVVFNSLASDSVLPLANQGTCKASAAAPSNVGLVWTYTITGCPDDLTITIDRGLFVAGQPTVSTAVTVGFPYHWRFNTVIQLLIPGASYAAITDLRQTATVQNQM